MPFKQRFGPASVILVLGFIVGVGLRFYLDDAAERNLANYFRSGLHGSGIAFAAWIVQGSFAAKAHSPIGAALRRMPLLVEVLVRSLAMTVVIVIVGLSLQIALYAESLQLHWLTVHWFKTTLPWIVAIGLTISLIVGVVTETVRLIGGPMLASIVLGTYHRPVREQLIVMFLDLADSTSLAEKLGELRVHDLITRFFFDIDEPINDHGGSVLSYVGDEVIVTWPKKNSKPSHASGPACIPGP
jgi:riboflavin transporter FmnP